MHSVAQDAQDRGVLCQVLLLMMVQPDLLLDHGYDRLQMERV